jgi:nucleotide-binding universal stress UspA family protein
MIEQYEVLIPLQGIEESRTALEYGTRLAGLLGRPVMLLAIRGRAPAARIEAQVAEAAAQLEPLGLAHRVEQAEGPLAAAVERQTGQGDYLTVYNAHPQDLWQQLVQGDRFRHLMAHMRGPILRVRSFCWPLTRALVCSGGLAYARPLEQLAIELARAAGASLTLLHVVPPVTREYELAQDLAHHWQNLLETDTPQAEHFRGVLQAAEAAGVPAELRVRHGPVVEQILAEVGSGDYQLVGMGSPFGTHNLSRLYRPNVTASVAEQVDCPILTVH